MKDEPVMRVPAPNLVMAARNFNRIAGRAINRFDAGDAGFQIGMMLEEMSETIEAVVGGTVTSLARSQLHSLVTMLKFHATAFKHDLHRGDVLRSNRLELLDGMIDVAWVSIGGGFAVSDDFEGAVAAVASANLSKFPNGVATKDPATGKIVKPAGWKAADLSEFVTLADPEK